MALGGVLGPFVASDSDTAYLSTAAAVCAVRLSDGKDRWCKGSAASSVALTGGTLATVEADGYIHGRRAVNGDELWHAMVAPAPLLTSAASPPSAAAIPVQKVWSTGRTFLVARSYGPVVSDKMSIAELGMDGTQFWIWSGEGGPPGASPIVSQPYAVVPRLTSGAITVSQPMLVRLGRDGGALGVSADYSEPILFRLPKLYSQLQYRSQDIGDYALTFDVSVGDVHPGISDLDWHYEPDHQENSKLPLGTTCCGLITKRVGIEGAYVYGSAMERVYRYDLAAPEGQQPVLLSDQGQFVGGPYAGRIYVGRPDGVWSAYFNGRYVYQRLVIVYRLPTELAIMEFADRVAYAALTDGTVIAFAVDDGQPLIRARTPCTSFAGVALASSRVIYVCAAPRQAIAFPRMHPPS